MKISLCTAPTAVIVFGLLSCLGAQSGVVSPQGFAVTEGRAWEMWPFVATGRLQQVHGDLRGSPLTIRSLAFRRDTGRDYEPGMVARTLDAELGIGHADYATRGGSFAANYQGARVVGYARRPLSLPDLTQASPVRPAVFSVAVPLDAPFLFSGMQDIAWDLAVFANDAAQQYYFLDSHYSFNSEAGATSFYGNGCTAGNVSWPLLLDASVWTQIEPDQLSFLWKCSNLPTGGTQPVWLLLGTVDPDLAVPGLCTRLRCDPMVAVPGTAPLGVMTVNFSLPWNPGMLGTTVRAQGIGGDTTQSGLPFVLSNGASASVPGLPTPMRVSSVLSFYDAQASAGSVTKYSGLVVRFGT